MKKLLSWNLSEPKTYIDIGAFHAVHESVTYLLYLRGWTGIVFDSSKESEQSFKQFRCRDRFIRAAVGSEDLDSIAFYVKKSPKEICLR